VVIIDGLEHLAAGKVRDVYAVDDDHVLLVASDRVSTYDVVHPTLVPDKGRVLTGLSAFWFERLGGLGAHHLVTTSVAGLPARVRARLDEASLAELRGRMMLCRRVEIVPFECVVRGYLAGSGWREYQQQGEVCGVALPDGLQEASALPEPIFTPATKAERGEHDENVSFAVMVDRVGRDLAEELRARALALYAAGAAHAADHGIILADTKFEFGLLAGEVVLAGRGADAGLLALLAGGHVGPGSAPPSFDKQFVRDYATSTGLGQAAASARAPARGGGRDP
jgi:phosphoribosylaminoimidazole-succinocarboxamide synthase